ncbi:MAG: transcription antiterminator, partial [Erysipelotrichaceae bacterium]
MKSALSFLSPRLIICLSRLALAQDYLSVQSLADASQSSKRTLFRELQDIDKILEPYHLSLVSKTGLGLRLLGSNEDKRHFNSILLQFKVQQNTIDKEDRQQALLAELLKNKSLQKLSYYAHQFKVSEASISIDISNLEPQLKAYNLSLVRRPGFNLWLDGEEEDFHQAIHDFIILHSQEDSFSRLISSDKTGWDIEETFKSKSGQSVMAYLNPNTVSILIDVFKDKLKLLSSLNQNTISGLIIHLACAIDRISDAEYIVNQSNAFESIKQDSLYDQAIDLIETIEDEFNISFPKIETAYIMLHLKGSRLLYIDDIEQGFHEDNAQSYDAQKLVYILIDAFERSSRLALKHDQVLIDNLVTHMKGTLIRKYKGISLHNPLLKQIQTQSSDVYRQTEEAMQEVFIRHQIPLTSDEVAYYTLHFASAIERLKHIEVFRTVNIAIVCASGIGVSNILASRIKRLFKQDVTISIRSHQDLSKLPK